MIELIIADDHQMFREGISALLKDEKEINILYTARNGKEVLNLLKIKVPEIFLAHRY